jgi:hypothetical protein
MTFSYLVDWKRKENLDKPKLWKEGQKNYYFWTETQVSKIPDLLLVLKEK